MKWTNTFSALLVMMTMTFAFTSCDEDPWDDGWDYYDYSQGWYDDYDWYDDAFDYGNNTLKQEAQALRGYWTGKVENRYYDQQNQLQKVQMDAEFEFDLYNSNALNGRGRETDYAPMIDDYGNYVYDDNGQLVYDSQQLRFSWYIDPRSGDICIKYDGSGYEYRTSWNGGFSLNTQTGQFCGTFNGCNNNEQIAFSLTRTTLAKPNLSFDNNGSTAASDSTATSIGSVKGQTFGTLNGQNPLTFSSRMGLRKR